MLLESFKKFQAEWDNPEKYKQPKFELGAIAFASLVACVCRKILNKTACSAAECLAAGLSSLVLTHLVDATAAAAFKGTYTRGGAIQLGVIGSTTALAITCSNHILSKTMPGAVTNNSYLSLITIYGALFPLTFKSSEWQ